MSEILSKRFDAHIESMKRKMDAVQETKTPVPGEEFQRDISISIDLYQQYIDLLDEILESIETEGVLA